MTPNPNNFHHCIRLGDGLFDTWDTLSQSFQVITVGVIRPYQFYIRRILFSKIEHINALLSWFVHIFPCTAVNTLYFIISQGLWPQNFSSNSATAYLSNQKRSKEYALFSPELLFHLINPVDILCSLCPPHYHQLLKYLHFISKT